jgi:predicted DsbA family dithiol-disulfide isomerase
MVFADFVCPFSFIAQDQMDELERNYDVKVTWRPHWLHPDIPPEGRPLPATSPENREARAAWLREMAPERAARMQGPGKMVYSFHAFEALFFAEEVGMATPFRQAIYDALWMNGKDIGRFDVLQETAESLGMDAEALGRALRDRKHTHHTFLSILAARELKLESTPTAFLCETRVVGWHYYEVFETLMEQNAVPARSIA